MTTTQKPREWTLTMPVHCYAAHPSQLEVKAEPILEQYEHVVVIEKSYADALKAQLEEKTKALDEATKAIAGITRYLKDCGYDRTSNDPADGANVEAEYYYYRSFVKFLSSQDKPFKLEDVPIVKLKEESK